MRTRWTGPRLVATTALIAVAMIVAIVTVYGGKQPTAQHGKAQAVAEAPPVQVLVSKTTQPGRVTYRYRVVNGSAFPITSLLIGFEYFHNQPEIRMFNTDALPADTTSPPGWHFDTQPTEEDSLGNILWEVNDPSNGIVGGAQLLGFSIARPTEETTFETGHWTVYINSAAQSYYSDSLLEESPGVSVPPSSISGANGIRLKPNPARVSVAISFQVPVAGPTSVTIFDVRGRAVREVLKRELHAGVNSVTWDGHSTAGAVVQAGTYFVRIKTPTTERFARLTWVR